MKKSLFSSFILVLAVYCGSTLFAHEKTSKSKPFSKTLLRADIKGLNGKEIIISFVQLPPGKSSPLHTHPGEEFAYLISGKAIQKLGKAKEEVILPGQVAHIPSGVPHYVRTDDLPIKAIVFRIHEKGKPERKLIK